MKTQRLLLFVVVLLLILLIINVFISLKQDQYTPSFNDRTEANEQIDEQERVKSPEERARMENYLEEYYKDIQIVKTIVGPSGEMIDCVDLYSQPALRKNKISKDQVKFAPSTFPVSEEQDSSKVQRDYYTGNMLYDITGDSCPPGAIPLLRLDMKTLTRFETLDDFFKKGKGVMKPQCGDDDDGPVGHEYAHAERGVDNFGGESILNLWSPYTEQRNEFSLSQLWVVRGSGDDRETLEAGWQAYKDLYGDWNSHLFIYFTPDNYGSGGGYNLTSGGFVQTNGSVYIGGGFTVYSAAGGAQYDIKLLIYKDGEAGDWWLRFGDTWVGYWPRSLFDSNGLRDIAGEVDFGGEIINRETDGRHTRTDMGSGYFPSRGFSFAAYHRNIKYVNTSRTYRNATGLSPWVSNASCYNIDLVESSGSWDVYFYYGGSGFNTSCP